jgi:hypothetical protein
MLLFWLVNLPFIRCRFSTTLAPHHTIKQHSVLKVDSRLKQRNKCLKYRNKDRITVTGDTKEELVTRQPGKPDQGAGRSRDTGDRQLHAETIKMAPEPRASIPCIVAGTLLWDWEESSIVLRKYIDH